MAMGGDEIREAFSSVGQINAAVLRPFREKVDLSRLILALVLVLVAAGMWHLVLERVDREVKEL